MIAPEIIRIGRIECGIGHQTNARLLTGPTRNGIIETVFAVDERNIRRPEITVEAGRGVSHPRRWRGEDSGPVLPQHTVVRGFGEDAWSGAVDVVTTLVLDDGGRIMNAETAAWAIDAGSSQQTHRAQQQQPHTMATKDTTPPQSLWNTEQARHGFFIIAAAEQKESGCKTPACGMKWLQARRSFTPTAGNLVGFGLIGSPATQRRTINRDGRLFIC